jgi:hypothetical protein
LEQSFPPLHAAPHAPQFAASVNTSTQALPQDVFPLGQPHAPARHVCIVPQVCMHDPQLALLDDVSTQTPPQFVRPGPQTALHAPPLHTLSFGHALWQPPQLAGSVVGSTHAVSQVILGDAHAPPALPLVPAAPPAAPPLPSPAAPPTPAAAVPAAPPIDELAPPTPPAPPTDGEATENASPPHPAAIESAVSTEAASQEAKRMKTPSGLAFEWARRPVSCWARRCRSTLRSA